jgi:CHAD domain-containing protein
VRAAVSAQAAAIRRHAPRARRGQDPEALHHMRTAIRRLRAILRAVRRRFDRAEVDRLRAELRWLGRTLGAARDADVLRAHLRHPLARLARVDPGTVRRLRDRLDAQRVAARTRVAAALASRRYRALADALEVVSRRPPPDGDGEEVVLADVAAAQFKKLRKAVEALAAEPTDRDLHAVRIKVKRARYTGELARLEVGRRAVKFVDQAARVQDVLGEHQDAAVAERRLRRLLAGARGGAARATLHRLIERQRRRRRAARAAFRDAWPKLARRGRKAWR